MPDIKGSTCFPVKRAGTGHGLSVWFDTLLSKGIGFSNAPSAPQLIYGSAFFPWLESVKLNLGDQVTVTIAADLVGSDYIFRWNSDITDAGGKTKTDFQQSNFFSSLPSPEKLRKRASSFVPTQSEAAQAAAQVLQLIDGKTTLEEIATRLIEIFPHRYSTWDKALAEVADISQCYNGDASDGVASCFV